MGMVISHDMLLGRWRLSLELFGRVFMEDVGAEPGSVCSFCTLKSVLPDKNIFQRITFDMPFFLKILTELGGFEVKESKFRREMEKLRNQQSRDLSLEVKVFGFSYFNYSMAFV
jgi:E3 ubiquitin-protein ligase EDD1